MIRHVKDREDVLQRSLRQSRRAYETRRDSRRGVDDTLWRLAGEFDGVAAVDAERAARRQAVGTKAQSHAAKLARKRADYDVVRRRLRELTRKLAEAQAEGEDSEESEKSDNDVFDGGDGGGFGPGPGGAGGAGASSSTTAIYVG